MPQFIRYVQNEIYTPTRKTVKGKEFLIAPTVALKEGVYKGEFVSEDEIQNNPEGWNGRPVVINHPVDLDGMPVSANDPVVLSENQIGFLYNVRADGDKLKGEVWIDLEMAGEVKRGNDVVQILEENIGMMEVSTAYFRGFEFEPGVYNGEYYEGRSLDIKPDHLAILLEAEGECSKKDGCGFPRVNSKEDEPMEKEQLEEGFTLFERGVETLRKAFKSNLKRSNNMNEKIKAIVDSGLVAFSQEELEGFCDEKIESLHKLVTAPPKEEPVTEPVANEETPEETLETKEDEPVSITPQVEQYLEEQFADFGGMEGVKTTLSGIRANKDEERAKVVARLSANKSCPLGEADLKALPLDTLKALDRSYAPADYSGMGSGDENLMVQAKKEDLVEFKAPKLIEKES